MTITEKILGLHAGRDSVKPGEYIEVNVDLAMAKIGHFSKVSNRRIEDLRVAAKILKDRSVPQKMRLIVIPGSSYIFKKAIQEGIEDYRA